MNVCPNPFLMSQGLNSQLVPSTNFDFCHGKERLCTFDFDALDYSEDLQRASST